MNTVNWQRISNIEALAGLRKRLSRDDIEHLMTLTHRAGGPALLGPFSGFGSSMTTHLWFRDVNSNALMEVAFIGVQWFVPPERLPLFGTFDHLDRILLCESNDAADLAARCSMIACRMIDSLPDFPSETAG